MSFAANAQNGDKHECPTPEQVTEKMAEELGLSADQKAKVLALNEEYKDVIGHHHHGPHGEGHGHDKADKGNGNGHGHGDRPELTEEQKAAFAARKAKKEEYESKLKTILTDEQNAKREEIRKQHREEHGHGHGHGNGQGHGNGKNK